MSSIASQVIFHPSISESLRFGGTTLGRDKIYRTIQYFARFYAWHLAKQGNKVQFGRWSALKSHLGIARKLLRLGKPLEHLQAASRAAYSSGPKREVVTTIGRQIAYFGYLTLDAITWAHSIRFIDLAPKTAKKITKRAFQLWFVGILFSLANGLLVAARLAEEVKSLRQKEVWLEKDLAEDASTQARIGAVENARKKNHRQLVIDLMDVWIPAAGAELLEINDGTLGLLGVITSILGAKIQWEAVNGKK